MTAAAEDDPGTVELNLLGDLSWFCSAVEGSEPTVVRVGERRSIKDLVESLGLPHVEVGVVTVDGVHASLDDLVAPRTRITLGPPTDVATALPERGRFVADVHLGTLARLLRLLGFDTWYAADADDPALVARAVDEDRILLSRDRKLLMRRVITLGYCPRSSDPDEQLDEVVGRYGLATRIRPFTRCAECNGTLEPVAKHLVVDELPPRVRERHDTFGRCSGCNRLYWRGTHVDAITRRLGHLLGESDE